MSGSRGAWALCIGTVVLCIACSLPSAAAFDGAPVTVSFSFSPAKSAYYPSEAFSIDVTVTNTMPLGDVIYDDLAYKEKVVNISAHFSWMAPNEYVWTNVSETSSWLDAEGGSENYDLNLSVPSDAAELTYSYSIIVEYLAHTAWGNITYYWGVGTTYRDFVVTKDTGTALSLSFDFSPVKASFAPGDEFDLLVTATATLPSGVDSADVFPCKVVNVSVYFSWMPQGETVWSDVGETSQWLHPLDVPSESYTLPLSVPDDLPDGTYTYTVKVQYVEEALWAEVGSTWGSGVVYRDFAVSSASGAWDPEDYIPFIAAVFLIVAVGAIGAAMYYRDLGAHKASLAQGPKAPTVFDAADGQSYPIIRPMPGEHFPIEKGFVYLVKEKRPIFSFQMFNEAAAHGAKGLMISREHPSRLRDLYGVQAAKVMWLTRRVGKDHVDPTELSLLSLKISRYVEESQRSVVMLEGLEYLVTQNDFEAVFRFVNHMLDFVLAHDSALIVTVDPRTLSVRELALLERSAKVVEPVELKTEEAPAPADEQRAQQPA